MIQDSVSLLLNLKTLFMKKTPLLWLLIFISIRSMALWSPLGSGLPDRVRALCVHNGELYAGGDFTEHVKKWDGISWVSVGGGLSGTTAPKVDALISYNGELYAGGSFSVAGSVSGNIAKFDGNNWVAVGDGLGGVAGAEVKCLYEWNGTLYAGGTFVTSGNSSLSKIGKLISNSWQQVGGSAPTNCSAGVYAISAYYNELYVGGQGSAPWMNKLNVAGTAWLAMPSGGLQTGVGVYALAPFKYPNSASVSLFIGGDFTGFPSPTCCILYAGTWGSSMNTFSSGVSDQINTFLSTSDFIYAGGAFTVAGIHTATNVTKRSTSLPWDTVGVTFNNAVNAFAIYNGSLVAGGQFTFANGTSVNHIAINDGVLVSDNARENSSVKCMIYPNPASVQLSILIDQMNAGMKSIEIFDLLGIPIYDDVFSSIELKIDVSNLPKGIYFYVLKEDAKDVKKGKFIID